MKLKIEKVYRNDKDKNGKPFISKKGQPYSKITIYADEKYYSGFSGKWNEHWSVGDEVEVDVETVQHNGSTFYNLKAPQSGGGANLQQIEGLFGALNTKLDSIIEMLRDLKTSSPGDDIPF